MTTSAFTLQQKDAKGRERISGEVFAIFHDYLKTDASSSSSSSTTEDAARVAVAVSKLAPTPADGSNTLEDGFFFSLWKDVIRVAEQIPHDHPAMDKLVKFMRELTLLPDTGLQVWDNRLWTDLPVLGAAFREHLNGPGTSKQAEEQARIDREWVRFHAFAAKLMGAGVASYANQAVWMLRDALEEEDEGESAKAPEVRDRDLATAAMYIEYAGPVLAESVVRTPEPSLSREDERLLRAGPRYGGRAGLGSDRWLFWLGRFREEAGRATDGEARALALRSARLMEIWVEKRLKA